MNRRTRCFSIASGLAAALLVFVAVAWAENSPNQGSAASTQPGQSDTDKDQGTQRISGTISSIDPASQTMIVKGALFSKTILVGSDAQITIEGKSEASLSDLSVGDRVDVAYHLSGKTYVAERVTRTQAKSENSGASRGTY
ncbi:MAG TPA: DUF5666 domain-containing protein [Verrucomicrobiae bacterium]|nr:DUF5666 domain-containing protein [Verrucomicrobiae bacterium]